jgi:hypothetical protein
MVWCPLTDKSDKTLTYEQVGFRGKSSQISGSLTTRG